MLDGLSVMIELHGADGDKLGERVSCIWTDAVRDLPVVSTPVELKRNQDMPRPSEHLT